METDSNKMIDNFNLYKQKIALKILGSLTSYWYSFYTSLRMHNGL